MKPFVAAADWGTTSFRLWLLAEDGSVLAERRSDDGLMAAREAGGFSETLESHLAALGAPLDLPVLLCGMVGSRTGWVEAPYLDAPLALREIGRQAVRVPGTRRSVSILPGLAQRHDASFDVMRGEETKLLGLGRDDGTVVMPGTHGKWACLAGGQLRSFATFMTGELFALLSTAERSVLREAAAVPAGETVEVSAADPIFLEAVRDGAEDPHFLLNHLFSLRAGWLLAGRDGRETRARLSGLLLGSECAGARERLRCDGPLVVVADGPAGARQAAAIRVAGLGDPEIRSADEAVRAGLLRAARQLRNGGEAP